MEFLFWMVVVSLAAAGIVPLLGQVLTALHQPSIGLQAHWLAQGMVEQMNAQETMANGFDQIQAGTCRKPDGITPWVDETTPLTCQVALHAAETDFTLKTVTCSNQPYAGGNYKCVIVALRHRQTNEPIAQLRALFARPASL